MTVSIELGLQALLLADPTIAAAVADRISAAPAPQNQTYPFITWQRISTPRVSSLGGPSHLASPTFQVDVYSDSREQRQGGSGFIEARAIATAVRQALDGYDGLVGSQRGNIALQDERDSVEDEPRIVRVSMDFKIWHQED